MITEDYYGDKFRWFVGVVKDTDGDANRVRVRIFGIHHIEDQVNVSDGDLPLALVLLPTTGGQTGGGSTTHGLSAGTWVFGFFADGDDCQQPVIVGVVAGGVGSTDNSTTPSASGSGTITPGSIPGDTTAGSPAGDSTTPITSNLAGNSNIEKAYNFFREKIEQSGRSSGNVHAQVAGIIGNLLEESNLQPNGARGDRGTAYGIAQWRNDRRELLKRMYGEPSTLEQQLSFVWHEFNNDERRAFARLMVATDVVQATDAMVSYERPRCWKGSYINKSDETYPGRLRKAQQVYNTIKYTPRTQ